MKFVPAVRKRGKGEKKMNCCSGGVKVLAKGRRGIGDISLPKDPLPGVSNLLMPQHGPGIYNCAEPHTWLS